MEVQISKRLFTVHDYHRMVDAGILTEDDRVELIRGEILAMSPIGPRHNAAVLRANNTLVRIVGDRAIVGVQGSIRLDEYDHGVSLSRSGGQRPSCQANPAKLRLRLPRAKSGLPGRHWKLMAWAAASFTPSMGVL